MPIPDNSSSCGLWIAPAASMTSRLARTVYAFPGCASRIYLRLIGISKIRRKAYINGDSPQSSSIASRSQCRCRSIIENDAAGLGIRDDMVV